MSRLLLAALILLTALLPAWAQSPAAATPSGLPSGAASVAPEASATPTPSATPSPSSSPSAAASSSAAPSPSAAPSSPPAASPSPAATPSAAAPAKSPEIAAPVVLNHIELLRVPGAGDLTPRERAQILTDRLEVTLDHATEAPEVLLDMVKANPVLASEGVQLMTVTDRDAAYLDVPKAVAAVQYRTQLERGLGRVWAERNGLLITMALRHVAVGVVIGLLLHVLIRWAARRYMNSPGWFGIALVWLVVGAATMLAFPQTRGAGQLLSKWLVGPMVKVLCIGVVALMLWASITHLLNKYFATVLALQTAGARADSRAPHRINAVLQASLVVVNVLLTIVVMAGLLNVFNVNASTVLASAGIIGVALGVAAQDLLRDMVAGLSILLEDQFGVGDFIKGGGVSGEVVGFTLRATRIRNVEGSLITVPNTMMRVVENQSNEWSQADVQVRVSPGMENVQRAVAIMEKAGTELLESSPDRVLEAPAILGTERISPSAVTLRMLIKTAPSKQWGVRRDMLTRLATLFEEAGVRTPRSLYDEGREAVPRP